MPKVIDKPRGLRPFLAHGVDLQWNEGEEQAHGDCPFCDREGRFFVNKETGQWD